MKNKNTFTYIQCLQIHDLIQIKCQWLKLQSSSRWLRTHKKSPDSPTPNFITGFLRILQVLASKCMHVQLEKDFKNLTRVGSLPGKSLCCPKEKIRGNLKFACSKNPAIWNTLAFDRWSKLWSKLFSETKGNLFLCRAYVVTRNFSIWGLVTLVYLCKCI